MHGLHSRLFACTSVPSPHTTDVKAIGNGNNRLLYAMECLAEYFQSPFPTHTNRHRYQHPHPSQQKQTVFIAFTVMLTRKSHNSLPPNSFGSQYTHTHRHAFCSCRLLKGHLHNFCVQQTTSTSCS